MRQAVLCVGLIAALVGPCDTLKAPPAAEGPAILAAGNLNNFYVAAAGRADGVVGFRYWQRDAQGMWQGGEFGRGVPAAVAAWREDLLVFFQSGCPGRFGLGRPEIEPSPVPSWEPVAACEDGLAADAFGWNAAGEPILARFENGQWSWRKVEASLDRDRMAEPVAVRFGGRLFLVWREEVPTLTGAAPEVRLRFLYEEKDQWHGPVTSRLHAASAFRVAADAKTMVCLFRKDAEGGGGPPWALATYATADEDWHEIGPLEGTIPDGPLALGRLGPQFYVAALQASGPVVAPLDVAKAQVDAFTPLAVQPRQADGDRDDSASLLLFVMAALATLVILATLRRTKSRLAVPAAPLPGAPAVVYAPLLRRGLAIGIDYLLVSMLVVPVIAHLAPELPERLLQGEPISWPEFLILYLARLPIILYGTVAEALFGRTLGKKLLGLEVRTEAGLAISWWQALVRNGLRLIDELPPSLYLVGLGLILVGPKPQRLGDRLAHTLVVVAGPRPVPGADGG